MPIAINGTGTISGVSAGGLTSASNGRILQVVQTIKVNTFTTTSTSYTDITGMSVSITPTSASSKVLVVVTANTGTDNTYRCVFQLVRNSTPVGGGTAVGSRSSSIGAGSAPGYMAQAVSYTFLDSPATTSATTYKLQGLMQSGGAMYFNYTLDDNNDPSGGRFASTITVMEIAA
jgi:hypothetical protein